MIRFIASAFASLILFLPAAFAQLETGPLTIMSGETEHSFTVELANDPEEVQTGLMNREELAADTGMLFDFGQPREANMWMKNTLIPLDLIFIAPDSTIESIAANAEPYSLESIRSQGPVIAVLELAGGRAAALGIEGTPGFVIGDTVVPGYVDASEILRLVQIAREDCKTCAR